MTRLQPRRRPRLHAGRLLTLFAPLCLSALAPVAFAQTPQPQAQPTPQATRLSKVEFEGLARVRPEEALERTGLQVGQSVDDAALEAAAARLMESGLFRKLSFSVRGTTKEVAVRFEVEEAKWGMPVVFDNFVWFSEGELTEAVRRRVPTFDGTAPEAGGVTDSIKQALQELLRERKIEGTVEYTPSADLSGRNAEHVFEVKGAALRVCRLSFPGARAVTEEALTQKSGGIFDNEYSRKFVTAYVQSSLLPLFHERGYLRAGFLPPKVKPGSGEGCEEGGLNVTVPVDEGAIYVWDKAEWSGNQALTAQELNAALAMRPREVANGVRLEKGLAAVRKAYARKGHFAAKLMAAPAFDDAARRVSYRFEVEEGPQYRMGTLYITGLDERDENNLRGRWRLLPGEVFDQSYPDEFVKRTVPEFAKELLSREGRKFDFAQIEPALKVNADKLTVDVTINFK